MLKKSFTVVIAILCINLAWAKTDKSAMPDQIILNLCNSLSTEIVDALPKNTQHDIKTNPIACANFIQAFISSYLNTKENNKKPYHCKSPWRFPMGEDYIIVCPQELPPRSDAKAKEIPPSDNQIKPQLLNMQQKNTLH